MNLPDLLDELHRRVPEDAPIGTRCKLASIVQAPGGAHQVAVAARIDAQGRRREQFWCDDVRVERPLLLRLTCPERECPHAVQVRAQWEAFLRRGRVTVARPKPLRVQDPAAEITVRAGGLSFTARPARFPCFTPCPHGAHPPMTIDKTGFDLFDDGGCVGGGVTETQGVRRPHLPTLHDAQAYVRVRQLEARATIDQARESSRGRPGSASGAG